MPHPLLIFGQSDYLIRIVAINSHIKWQTVQIQISWLLWKPTDLDLLCLQRQGISGFSRTRVNCTPVNWGWFRLYDGPRQLILAQCSSIPAVLFDNLGIFKCLNTFLLSPHHCFIIGFICDLFVACNERIRIPPHEPNKYIFLPLWKLRARVGIS